VEILLSDANLLVCGSILDFFRISDIQFQKMISDDNLNTNQETLDCDDIHDGLMPNMDIYDDYNTRDQFHTSIYNLILKSHHEDQNK
jgi:hypothetical protein